MKKAWSVFWLVIASVVAFYIVGAMIQPYLPLLAAVLIVAVIFAIGVVAWRFISHRRRFF